MPKKPNRVKPHPHDKGEPLIEELVELIEHRYILSKKTAAALHTAKAAKAVRATVEVGATRSLSRHDVLCELVDWLYHVESGVEAVFACALFKLVRLRDPEYVRLVDELEAQYAGLGMDGRVGLFKVCNQLPPIDNSRYRCDFWILFLCTLSHPNGDPGTIVDYWVDVYVECDSFHTHGDVVRVAADDRRTRQIAIEKIKEGSTRIAPIRFSEHEIMRDGRGCALELIRIALSMMPDEKTVVAQRIRSTELRGPASY